MPTASGYITVTGQRVTSSPDWSNPTNVSGAPDANVASVSVSFNSPEILIFSHGLSIPSGAEVSEVRATLRIKGSTNANVSYKVLLSGLAAEDIVLNEALVALPTGSLQDLQLTETGTAELANCTPSRINDGTGYLQLALFGSTVTIELDSVFLEVDYTVPRNVAPYCNRKFVKSPLIQLP